MIRLVYDAATAIKEPPPVLSPHQVMLNTVLGWGAGELACRLAEAVGKPVCSPEAASTLGAYCYEALRRRRIALAVVNPDYGHPDSYYIRSSGLTEEQLEAGLEELRSLGLLELVSAGRYSLPVPLLDKAASMRAAS